MTRRQTGKSGGGKAPTRGSSGRSYRGDAGLTRQPKKMRGRKPSSQRWLTRQLNDPFVADLLAPECSTRYHNRNGFDITSLRRLPWRN